MSWRKKKAGKTVAYVGREEESLYSFIFIAGYDYDESLRGIVLIKIQTQFLSDVVKAHFTFYPTMR